MTAASNSGGRLRLLIGEGPDDAEFFKALIEARGLQTLNYRVMSTAPKGVGAGGNTKFQEALSIVNVKPVFRDILLVTDCDDDCAASFEFVRAQVERFFGKAPTAPNSVIDVPPRLMIAMVPSVGVEGNLETLCKHAAESADGSMASKTENYRALVQADKWKSPSRREEMWLRANLAARSERDPFITLRNVFSDPKNRWLVPLDNPAFDPFEQMLRDFAS